MTRRGGNPGCSSPPPRAQSREQGAAADTWLFCHQHSKTLFGLTAKHLKQQSLPVLHEITNYSPFLFKTLKGLADIQVIVLAWTRLSAGVGDKYSFPLVLKQVG